MTLRQARQLFPKGGAVVFTNGSSARGRTLKRPFRMPITDELCVGVVWGKDESLEYLNTLTPVK